MRALGTLAVVLAVGAVAPALAEAQNVIIGGAGKRGQSGVGQSTCKYRMFNAYGALQVGVPQPAVSGANTRRGTSRERTYVRYRVYLTSPWQSHATISTSHWSGWIRVRQSGAGSWSTPTIFEMDWRGNYGADVRIEWWNKRRMIGWRAYRMTTFHYYDQFNIGPIGPLSSCFKPTWDRPLPQ